MKIGKTVKRDYGTRQLLVRGSEKRYRMGGRGGRDARYQKTKKKKKKKGLEGWWVLFSSYRTVFLEVGRGKRVW